MNERAFIEFHFKRRVRLASAENDSIGATASLAVGNS
jgi:hypothetical protein